MSFDIAVSGLRAAQEYINSTSHNIANAQTDGYKSSRTTFASAYGGAQAMGVEVMAGRQDLDKTGALRNGGRLDAALGGPGFFVVRGSDNLSAYTRVGSFEVDSQGFLIDGASRRVQGFKKLPGGGVGGLGDIQIPPGNIALQASTKLQFARNFDSAWDPKLPAAITSSYSRVYDARGAEHKVTQNFVRTGIDTIEVTYEVDGAVVAGAKSILTFDDKNEKLLTSSLPELTLTTPLPGLTKLTLDYADTTLSKAPNARVSEVRNDADGWAAGSLTSVSLATNGNVVANYSNGQTQVKAALAIANFADQNALRVNGKSSWLESPESGIARLSTLENNASGMTVGKLESSNVDTASELTDLIAYTNFYQANAKSLSTQDKLMQTLMQAT